MQPNNLFGLIEEKTIIPYIIRYYIVLLWSNIRKRKLCAAPCGLYLTIFSINIQILFLLSNGTTRSWCKFIICFSQKRASWSQ